MRKVVKTLLAGLTILGALAITAVVIVLLVREDQTSLAFIVGLGFGILDFVVIAACGRSMVLNAGD